MNKGLPEEKYDVVIANHALHHFVELEKLFDGIHRCLRKDGFFITCDMIGRNGHMRWPEALELVHEFWKELPRNYRFNHQLQRSEDLYQNWDCSVDSFEGIRAQDILPLLVGRFHFDLFIGYGNVVDVFVERGFGPNFDADAEWDRSFIDRIQACNQQALEAGRVTPTQMIAALCTTPRETKVYKHLTPEFCLRRTDELRSDSD